MCHVHTPSIHGGCWFTLAATQQQNTFIHLCIMVHHFWFNLIHQYIIWVSFQVNPLWSKSRTHFFCVPNCVKSLWMKNSCQNFLNSLEKIIHQLTYKSWNQNTHKDGEFILLKNKNSFEERERESCRGDSHTSAFSWWRGIGACSQMSRERTCMGTSPYVNNFLFFCFFPVS